MISERERNAQVAELRERASTIMHDVGLSLLQSRDIYEFDIASRHRVHGYFLLRPSEVVARIGEGSFALDVEISPTMSTPDEMMVGVRLMKTNLLRQAWSEGAPRHVRSAGEERALAERPGHLNLLGLEALKWSAEELKEFML